ncbi:YqjF family protein [Aeoliella mucimassa]|uniref:DUF2071 domain-containing protein n=1 Tax=Aeoliella mucimassa TaxID=2527972 RepID=A0A518AH32_9BACT|nr:DUF2071 domain-containing protein [Aeoliella mucimassa]QDU54027.1 hypothetical protein Pan181_02070 [Aeoliella mucimassa]
MRVPDLQDVSHRSWPCPQSAWTWQQRWYDLAFVHWPIEPAALRPLIPAALELDTFDQTAWIGVVPFAMRIRRRGMPGLPTASSFPEINVRTYVKHLGKPGVWFFSLDAASRLAVWGARWWFHLPYYLASFEVTHQDDTVVYHSRRREQPAAEFSARYRPTGPVFQATPGSLEHWLAERYCLYSHSPRGELYRGEIHHGPWPLQTAEAEISANSMLAPLRLQPHDTQPLVHFAQSIDVVAWGLTVASG